MVAPKNSLTEESLEKDLRNWKEVVSNVSDLLDQQQRYLKIDNPEAVVAEHQSALQEVKFYEGKLQPYQEELDKVLEILPKEKMQRYCKLKRREIREGVSSEVSGPLAKLRRGFDLAEKEAQPKLNILLSVVHECETALSLSRKHLKWVTSVAWKQGISLPEEAQTASQVADQERNPRRAGKKLDKNVERRTELIFKELNTTDLEEAKQRLSRLEKRHEIYRLLDQKGIRMIKSKNFRADTKWTELIGTGDDLCAQDTILKDLRRKWTKLLEQQQDIINSV